MVHQVLWGTVFYCGFALGQATSNAGDVRGVVLDATGNPRCGTITPSGLYTAPSAVPEGITCQITAAVRSELEVMAWRDRLTF